MNLIDTSIVIKPLSLSLSFEECTTIIFHRQQLNIHFFLLKELMLIYKVDFKKLQMQSKI